jgi:2-keto-4-pentenoate hydratase/2-oxohepta-3-ene-1,7-dioic acid hydratase in catechol pathway
MNSTSSSPAPVLRVFRLATGTNSWVVQYGEHWLDLSRYLASQRIPIDVVHLLGNGFFERAAFERRLAESDWPRAQPVFGEFGLDVPLPQREVGKILALGKNFREHAAEFGEAVPEEPLFFNKLPETLVPHGATVRVPPWYTRRVDHEAELAVVIARAGACIRPEDAHLHVGAYTVANDLTARSLQGEDREKKHPWFRAKNMDQFCPLGPCLVPRAFLDLADLRVTCRVNGELRQDASTRDFVVDVPHAIAYLSKHLTLRPGDVVLTGTPAGVGPLADGDVVECAVEGIGTLVTRIARPPAAVGAGAPSVT